MLHTTASSVSFQLPSQPSLPAHVIACTLPQFDIIPVSRSDVMQPTMIPLLVWPLLPWSNVNNDVVPCASGSWLQTHTEPPITTATTANATSPCIPSVASLPAGPGPSLVQEPSSPSPIAVAALQALPNSNCNQDLSAAESNVPIPMDGISGEGRAASVPTMSAAPTVPSPPEQQRVTTEDNHQRSTRTSATATIADLDVLAGVASARPHVPSSPASAMSRRKPPLRLQYLTSPQLTLQRT
jgi:hypothetical protein